MFMEFHRAQPSYYKTNSSILTNSPPSPMQLCPLNGKVTEKELFCVKVKELCFLTLGQASLAPLSLLRPHWVSILLA